MKRFNLRYKQFGESAILVEWVNEVNESILKDIRLFTDSINTHGIYGIVDFNFVYNSLLINYDNQIVSFEKLIVVLKDIYNNVKSSRKFRTKTWHIPVCYHHDFGLDLQELIAAKGMNEKELISLHTSPFYTVYGIGFLPGFLYLGGLSERLFTPRKNNPSLNVPSGSVAIGAGQTGIYPQSSPGGWHIIGNAPITLFDVKNDPPCFVVPGDQVKFYSITKHEYERLKIDVSAGSYNYNKLEND